MVKVLKKSSASARATLFLFFSLAAVFRHFKTNKCLKNSKEVFKVVLKRCQVLYLHTFFTCSADIGLLISTTDSIIDYGRLDNSLPYGKNISHSFVTISIIVGKVTLI